VKAGWDRKQLSELLQKTGSIDPTKEPQAAFTYIDVSSVSNETFSITETSDILGKDAPSRARRGVRAGDVIFATIRPTPKRVAIIPDELDHSVCSTGYFVLRSGAKINNRFLFYWLFSDEFEAEMEARQKGASYPAVNDSDIRDQFMPVPPLDEQRRIVAVLDKAFAGIATATANAQKNLTNARELSAAIPAGSSTVIRMTIGELLERRWLLDHMDGNHGGDYPRKDEFVADGVTYLSANSIRNGEVDFSRAKYLAPARAAKLRKGFARDRDVLFAHNATVGPVALLETDADYVILGTSLTYYRCDESRIKPEYLASYLASSAFKSQYEVVMRQSTRNQVPITKQREFYIDLPTVEEQSRMVASLVGFQESGRRLVKQYQAKLTALTELKQSLLQKAFAGELT
jgi:type I restriction enzyme S subunit